MKKTTKRLLRELTEIILCTILATSGGYALNRHIRNVVKKTIEDIRRTEWVQAAREISPLSETLGDNEPKR